MAKAGVEKAATGTAAEATVDGEGVRRKIILVREKVLDSK